MSEYTTLVRDWRYAPKGEMVRLSHPDWPDVVGKADGLGVSDIRWVRVGGANYGQEEGWRMFTATPEMILPTEPGWYVDIDGSAWRYDGEWWFFEESLIEKPGAFAPFQRLYTLEEATPIVAKKVFDRLATIATITSTPDVAHFPWTKFANIWDEFGVTP